MKKTIKNCLRKLCCNFCFMLLGTFSKAEIIIKVDLNEINTSIKSTEILTSYILDHILFNNGNGELDAKKISNNKKATVPFPKKRKKIVTQDSFEIRVLPKGEYTAQIDNNRNILITKKILVLK